MVLGEPKRIEESVGCPKMKLEQVLRLIVIAIVLMVAFSLLGFLLRIGSVLLGLSVKILVVLLLVAVVLRFIDLLRGKQA